jgi:hypothetical protein
MKRQIFELPVPATSLRSAPELHERLGRTSEIICEYEEEDDPTRVVELSLVFENRYAVRITNGFACDIETLNIAYAKVVDLGETNWLKVVKSNLVLNKGVREDLRHLGIYFDGGCLYEFICESFRVFTQSKSTN